MKAQVWLDKPLAYWLTGVNIMPTLPPQIGEDTERDAQLEFKMTSKMSMFLLAEPFYIIININIIYIIIFITYVRA